MKTAIDILVDLVSIRTDFDTRSNRSMVDYISDILQENDIPFVLIPTGGSNNILAGVNVSDLSHIDKGLILSAHMDTVGCSDKNWHTNPFQGIQKEGRIYGRGTVDMKYFIAVILSLLPQLKELSLPILLTFSCDEESNVQGIRDIIKFMARQNISPQYALVGEATNFDLAVSNRGYIGYQTNIHGVAGHAGDPCLGTNAIYISSQIISEIEKLSQTYAQQGVTLNVGKIFGGEGRNSIPADVSFDWEIRYTNDLLKNKILTKIKNFHQKLEKEYSKAVILTEIKETLPVFAEKEPSPLLNKAEKILKTDKIFYPFASEAGFFQTYGIDTLICGAGDLKQAHTTNESILISDIEKYAAFLLALIKQLPL